MGVNFSMMIKKREEINSIFLIKNLNCKMFLNLNQNSKKKEVINFENVI